MNTTAGTPPPPGEGVPEAHMPVQSDSYLPLPVAPAQGPAPMPDWQRRDIMAQVVADSVAGGARMESATDYQVVLVYGKNLNHLLHALLTLFTLFWGLVWLILACSPQERRRVVFVDAFGQVHYR
jgi:hypothetical protein